MFTPVEHVDKLRAYLNAKPHTTEEYPFGSDVHVYKVAGKMWAWVSVEEVPRATFKATPEENELWRAQYPEAILPGYHMNKFHWSSITLDGTVPEEELREIADRSYELVVQGLPKKVRQALGTGH